MKKADIKLIICLIFEGIIDLLAVLLFSNSGKTVIITKDNKQIFSGSINENKKIDLGTNVIEIKNGEVEVTSAVCNNQICVNHKKISKSGEFIACVPNGILITVE